MSVKRLLAAVAWALLALLPACSGGDGLDRIPLRGTVQSGSAPLRAGAISLLPEQGHPGPAVTTLIAQGRFEFTRETGPVAGPHRVIVQASLPGKSAMLAGAAAHGTGPQAPPKTRWELRAVVPDREPFQCDLKLE